VGVFNHQISLDIIDLIRVYYFVCEIFVWKIFSIQKRQERRETI